MNNLDRFPNETRGRLNGAALGYSQAECATQAATPTARFTAAMKINEQLGAMYDRVSRLAETAEGRLYSVTTPESPENAAGLGDCRERFPELFDGYQTKIDSINHALRRIESVFDRLEI